MEKDDPHAMTINGVLQQITAELKNILKKDFNKRMVENTAYKKLENWWDEQQSKSANKGTVLADITPIQKKSENISTILENHRDSLDLGGYGSSFGLGLRAQIPKMPSFRRIPKRASPKRRDSEKNLSDQEEIVQNSDDEKEPTTNEPRPMIRRKGSMSSFFTTSESSSGELSSSDSSSSDSEVEMEIKTRNTKPKETIRHEKSKLKIKDNRIYSTDSDSDDALSKISDRDTPIPDEEVSMSPTRPKTPGHDIELEPKSEIVPEPDNKPEIKPSVSEKKSAILEDRIYSDSDEEREYQERRRRNTEYMEQIEREFMEEQKRKEQLRMEQSKAKEEVEIQKAVSPKEKESDKPGIARLEEAEYLLSLSESGDRKVPRTPGSSYSAMDELVKLTTPEPKK